MNAALGFGIYVFELRHEGRLCAGRWLRFRRVVFSIRRGLFGADPLQPSDFPLSGSQLPAQIRDQSHQLAVR